MARSSGLLLLQSSPGVSYRGLEVLGRGLDIEDFKAAHVSSVEMTRKSW